MHDCDIATGVQWLQANLSGYLDWARTHNSLLVVTFDESDSQPGGNHIITLFDGAAFRPGRYDEPIDHYRLLRTIEEIYHLSALGKAASTTPITETHRSRVPVATPIARRTMKQRPDEGAPSRPRSSVGGHAWARKSHAETRPGRRRRVGDPISRSRSDPLPGRL